MLLAALFYIGTAHRCQCEGIVENSMHRCRTPAWPVAGSFLKPGKMAFAPGSVGCGAFFWVKNEFTLDMLSNFN